jgi:plasmid stabilization system protein ParE
MTFVDELLRICKELGKAPRASPLVPRYENREVRRRVHGNYLIFYRVTDRAVEVIQIVHAARDLDALLFTDT